jgi:hypothetical protein
MTVQYKYAVQKTLPRSAQAPALGGGIVDHILPDWFYSTAPEEDNFFFTHAPTRSEIFIKETSK